MTYHGDVLQVSSTSLWGSAERGHLEQHPLEGGALAPTVNGRRWSNTAGNTQMYHRRRISLGLAGWKNFQMIFRQKSEKFILDPKTIKKRTKWYFYYLDQKLSELYYRQQKCILEICLNILEFWCLRQGISSRWGRLDHCFRWGVPQKAHRGKPAVGDKENYA